MKSVENVDNKKIVLVSLYVVHGSIAYLLVSQCKITYVRKQLLICITKISCYNILNYKKKLLNNFRKFLKNILQLYTGLRFDICYVIKTRVGCKIQKGQDFYTSFSSYLLALCNSY